MTETPESMRHDGAVGGQPADGATGADDIPELYQIDSVEQLRAISDRLRSRIAELLGRRAMTVAQLSEELGLAHAKVHYHVRELEQVGLVRLVATREKSGILEKYYRAVARVLSIAPGLLRSMPLDESVATITEFVQQVLNDALRAFTLDLQQPRPGGNAGTLSESTLYLSNEEARRLMGQVADLLKPFEETRGGVDERKRTFVHLLYNTPLAGEDVARDADADSAPQTASAARERRPDEMPGSPAAPAPVRAPRWPQPPRPIDRPKPGETARPRPRTMVVAGVVSFSRDDLEHAVARGEPIRLNVLGRCHFDADIPADLVDRAIARFRLRGPLDASPEVRAVLQHKQRPDASKTVEAEEETQE